MAVDFCDYFWGEEHNGWNVLYQNMKQGHNASKELAEFFKERGSIDETYCKALYKLANKANINTEKGTLAPIFTLLKISSERMSSVHLQMVNKIQDLVKDVLKYNEELHKKQKTVKDEESQTEDTVKIIQTTSSLALKAKETYSQRCQDLEKLKRERASPKDVEKAETKLRKAHDEYKGLVDKYNTVRDEFEKKMIQSCKHFQTVEESHLSQIMLFVQTYIDVLQSDRKAMGQILQELVNKYSQLTIDKLLDNFVLSKLTGLEKPVMMVFEDTSSLGSAISGQQSPEPSTDQCRPSTEDASASGSGEKVLSGGVLTGGNDREWSAPPQLKCGLNENGERVDSENKTPPQWPHTGGSLPTSPTKVGHSPTSPSEDVPTITRSLFRSSKLALPGSGPILSFGFIWSRRDKKDKKKAKRNKETADSSSIKDDKSDNENSEEAKTADLISVGGQKEETANEEKLGGEGEDVGKEDGVETGVEDTVGSLGSSGDPEEVKVDEDGYTIRPPPKASLTRELECDSSSDSDSEIGIEKKIHVEIKPITNGAPPISASVDELRATIEGMSLSPLGFATPRKTRGTRKMCFFLSMKRREGRKTSAENHDNSMRRSNSITQQIGSSSADLLGLNLHFNANSPSPKFGTKEPSQDGSGGSNGTRKTSFTPTPNKGPNHSPHSTPPPRMVPSNSLYSSSKSSRYAELSEILGDASSSDSVPPILPPRGTSSRGSTPTPTMAIPRPSRKLESSRSVQSPATISALSRTESISSLEFRTSGMATGVSRGPSPLTIGMADTIPLAVAFQELCHAYFRGTDETRVQIKVTGEMMVSFPAGIVGVLANNPSPSQLSFKVQNFNKMANPLPNKQLVTFDESQSSENCGIYNFNMTSLSSLLKRQAEQNPSASYFNVDIIKYQVNCPRGVSSCPLHMVSYWRCEDDHTDLKVDYKYNEKAMSTPCSLLNINISVPIDGVVKHMQSKPTGQWIKEQQKAVWKVTELSQHSTDGGKGSLRGKFEVAAGPSTPATVVAQFNCEGTTLSGLEFALSGTGYRVSLVKKRFVSGKYICDGDAVLKLKYGAVPS